MRDPASYPSNAPPIDELATARTFASWRKARGVRTEDVTIPVETDPGEVAQVDFGYVGKLYDAAHGILRKATQGVGLRDDARVLRDGR